MECRRSAKAIKPQNILRNGSTFTVKSVSKDVTYQVIIEKSPNCGCLDFYSNCMPCKHMFAVLDKYSDISWKDFPLWFRDSPQMILDEEVCPQLCRSK